MALRRLNLFTSRLSKNTSHVRAVITDLAGTIVDDGSLAPLQAMHAVFQQELNLSISFDDIRKDMGKSKDQHIWCLLQIPAIRERWKAVKGQYPTQQDVAPLLEQVNQKLKQIVPSYTIPTPHSIEELKRLQKLGIKVAFTSGYPAEIVKIIVDILKTQYGFVPDFVIAADQVPGRTRAAMVNAALTEFKVPAEEAIFVTDAETDVSSVQSDEKSKHVLTVGVVITSTLMRFDSKEQAEEMKSVERDNRAQQARVALLKSGAHTTINDFKEFPGLVKQAEQNLQMGITPGLLKQLSLAAQNGTPAVRPRSRL